MSAAEIRKLEAELEATATEFDREKEVERILKAFTHSPYDVLGLLPSSRLTDAEIQRHYRRVSLLVHPDKCSHPKARDAFQRLEKARGELRDENRSAFLVGLVQDIESRLEADLPPGAPVPPESVARELRRYLAEAALARMERERRAKEDEKREREAVERAKAQHQKAATQAAVWEDERDERVANWRAYQNHSMARTRAAQKSRTAAAAAAGPGRGLAPGGIGLRRFPTLRPEAATRRDTQRQLNRGPTMSDRADD
ncbi:hypothetical protein H696_04336 [Fonticula alba]|uniref:J domain-containing protein n=1 Tax=Fonticula alba TaxID=691883 RepID=A0A058Z3T4_FONAL|nr:hypothetical protein H696_04336 [Fonticula alba]KCV68915.1 hypothetical protein H696_04336 [Fonticula alba]|eukprot:XP_009496486.1 hypothetical protein H696_04336 [Fonticula alba]